ncbi:hypothetical protein TrRE_jg11827, partial [Triparma retinervis]
AANGNDAQRVLPAGIKDNCSPLRNECISHGVSNVGNSAWFPFVSLLWLLLAKVMMHSVAAQALWKEVTGLSFTKTNLVRWFHAYEDIKKAASALDKLVEFITRCEAHSVSPEGVKQLKEFITKKPWSLTMIKIEVAEYVRLGKSLVECCYATEGDNQRGFRAHATFTRMQQILDDEEYRAEPNTRGNLITALRAQVEELEGGAVKLALMRRTERGRLGVLRGSAIAAQQHFRTALGIRGEEDKNEEQEAHKTSLQANKQIKQLVTITNELIMNPPVTEDGVNHWVRSAKEPARKHLHDMFDNPKKKLHSMRFYRGADFLRPDSIHNSSEEELRGRAEDLLSHP